jgi:hypothetical protein
MLNVGNKSKGTKAYSKGRKPILFENLGQFLCF